MLLSAHYFAILVALCHGSSTKLDVINNLQQCFEDACISSDVLYLASNCGSDLVYGLNFNGMPDISK